MKWIKKHIQALAVITLLLASFISCVHAQAVLDKQPHAIFTLLKNNEDGQSFTAQLQLTHLENLANADKLELGFNSLRPILSITNGELIYPKQGGDFYLVRFSIPKGSKQITFNLRGKWFIRKYSDTPSGYFVVKPVNQEITAVSSESILPEMTSNPIDNDASIQQKKENTSIEGNPVDTALTADTSLIVPLPAELKRNPGQFTVTPQTQIIYQDDTAFPSAHLFAQSIAAATGYTLTPRKYQPDQPLQNTILLTTQGIDFTDPKQAKEGYLLEATPSYIIIRALTGNGFFYGLQSLRQLLPPQIFSHERQTNIEWTIPSVIIRDFPRFEYRGLHLDSARHFMPTDQVKRLIDLMAIHKLDYFEWHLSDDEGWRIEIKRYPALTTKGAWRSYDPANVSEYDLLPAYGSGAKPYGGFYSQNEIRDIVQYANDRYITIIPEIDMPGHARAMIMSLTNELIDTSDKSAYTSVQGYHDNVLSPCKKETFTVIENILTEVAQLFPGKYIHIGGDEVPNGAWEKSCMAQKYNVNDPNFKELVQNEFLQKIQDIITSKGKVMAGWEELAGEQSTLASPLRVYIWNSNKIDSVYNKAVRQGYEVIMAPAENLYFDLAYNADPKEPGLYWAGYVDTFSAYSLQPIDVKKGQSDTVIKGVQGQLWSELIDSSERLDYMAFPKIAGLSELGWTPADKRNWKNFSARMREKHLLRLKAYGVQYRPNEFISSR